MKFDIYIGCLLICSFVLTFNVCAQNDLLDKADEFMTDYIGLSNQLITDLNCNDYQSTFDKSQWTRIFEFIFGKPKEQCCIVNDIELFDRISKDYKSLRDKSLYLQYELSNRIGFNKDCSLTVLMTYSKSFKNSIIDLLKCKNNFECATSDLERKTRSCQLSVDIINKQMIGRIPNTQTCLQTYLIKPVVQGINTIKEELPPILSTNFNQLLFDRLNILKGNINKEVTIVVIDKIIEITEQLQNNLVLLWTVQIANPKLINFKGRGNDKQICNTVKLSSYITWINGVSKKIKTCLIDKNCSQRDYNGKLDELIEEKNELVEMFIDNPEFKECMQDSLAVD